MHFCPLCGPKFWSMKITQDVRDYAAGLGDNEKAALSMKEMSDKFNAMGQQVYIDANKVNAPHTTALESETYCKKLQRMMPMLFLGYVRFDECFGRGERPNFE